MLRAAKGFRMRRSKLYRYASDAVDHGLQYAYRDRKTKKRNFRALWQVRINAAARAAGITYSRFMEGLKAAKIDLDRKILSDIAAQDTSTFGELVKVAQNALKTKTAKADFRQSLNEQESDHGRPTMAARFCFSTVSPPRARLTSLAELWHCSTKSPC